MVVSIVFGYNHQDWMSTVIKPGLREQKQELVRDALYAAAVDLFARNGFEETTVEEISLTAGVSRSTFFRHFDSKDDLISYPMGSYAAVLTEAIKNSSSSSTQLEVIQEVVLAGVGFTLAEGSRTKQVMEISFRSPAARQAYQSKMMDLQESLVQTYADRFDCRLEELRPRLLAGLTLTVMNTSILAWFLGKDADLRSVAKETITQIRSISRESPPNDPLPTIRP